MTIDKAINALYYGCYDYYTQTQAREKAIETMRKYQKIEQIVKAWNDMNSFDSMTQISEVIDK